VNVLDRDDVQSRDDGRQFDQRVSIANPDAISHILEIAAGPEHESWDCRRAGLVDSKAAFGGCH